MSWTAKELSELPAGSRSVHKVCDSCYRYFWVRIWARHVKACRRSKREESKRNEREWFARRKEGGTR